MANTRLLPSKFFALFCFLVIPFLSSNLHSQEVAQTLKDKKFADQFWNYLLTNNYKHWSPSPGKPTGIYANQQANNPHGKYLKLYMNRKAASNPSMPPTGSVIVLENYRNDKSLESISVMYKTPGFNPDAGDWYWVNYNADGSVASQKAIDQSIQLDANGIQSTFTSANATSSASKKLMGRAESCIQCHKKSSGYDLSFFNDGKNRKERVNSSPEQSEVVAFGPRNLK